MKNWCSGRRTTPPKGFNSTSWCWRSAGQKVHIIDDGELILQSEDSLVVDLPLQQLVLPEGLHGYLLAGGLVFRRQAAHLTHVEIAPEEPDLVGLRHEVGTV